ncbi:MAG: hypothetical protein PHW01_04875 [Patescibacteria group bacterium]|nr:hypothetical protein [Patescibacteria group bacterium]
MENSEERFKMMSKTEILVNLDAPPKLLSDDAKIEKNNGSGWVKVEKREAKGPDSGRDELYIDDRKVILYLSERQKHGRISGHELHKELSGKPVLHPNILDALLEHPNLIPEGWKNNNYYIFFWGTILRSSLGNLCVRYLCFSDDKWSWGYLWFDVGWIESDPAALLAS